MSDAKFLVGAELTNAIASITEEGAADLAVAFWGRGASKTLKLPKKTKALRVACDARSGACNPEAIEDLLSRGAQVVDVPRLHAKVYIGQNSVVISSANASTNGLVEEGDTRNLHLEAGYISETPDDVNAAQNWFKGIFCSGSKITKADLPDLFDLWKPREIDRPPRPEGKTFLEMILFDPEWVKDRNLKIFLYYPSGIRMPEDEEEYKNSPYYDEKLVKRFNFPPYYVNVGDLNLKFGDMVLEFAINKRKHAKCRGIWRVQDNIDNGRMVPAKYVDEFLGLKFSKVEQEKLSKLSDKAFELGKIALELGKDWYFNDDAYNFVKAVVGSATVEPESRSSRKGRGK